MRLPTNIGDGWFFEGNISLSQKQEILGKPSYAGYSVPFVECCQEFVAGKKSVRRFLPTNEEAERILATEPAAGMEHSEVPPEVMQILEAALAEKKTSD
jgi:hypothetical protein